MAAFEKFGIDDTALNQSLPSGSTYVNAYASLHENFLGAARGHKLRVLELWHGHSGYPVVLAHLGHKVTAVDPLALRDELKKCESVQWHRMNQPENIRPQNRFDAVIIRFMQWKGHDVGSVVKKIDGVTRPGGFHLQEFQHDSNAKKFEAEYALLGYSVQRMKNERNPRLPLLLARKPAAWSKAAGWLKTLIGGHGTPTQSKKRKT